MLENFYTSGLLTKNTLIDQDFLQVSEDHCIWYAEYGNQLGIPVIVLHGGPGCGMQGFEQDLFDSSKYRVIVFDQRGTGRSKYESQIKNNTIWDLVGDIESLRKHLKINKWLIFGGSWGSCLGLVYGINHPEACLGFLLRGVFFGTRKEMDKLIYDTKDFFPDVYEKMLSLIPEDRHLDLENYFYEKLAEENKDLLDEEAVSIANVFMEYDTDACFVHNPKQAVYCKNSSRSITLSRIFFYYYRNNCFLDENYIIHNLYKIENKPCIIMHGRFDLVCRVERAYRLNKLWPNSQLIISEFSGHAILDGNNLQNCKKCIESMGNLIN